MLQHLLQIQFVKVIRKTYKYKVYSKSFFEGCRQQNMTMTKRINFHFVLVNKWFSASKSQILYAGWQMFPVTKGILYAGWQMFLVTKGILYAGWQMFPVTKGILISGWQMFPVTKGILISGWLLTTQTQRFQSKACSLKIFRSFDRCLNPANNRLFHDICIPLEVFNN